MLTTSKLIVRNILDYYDGPQIVEAIDDIGGTYLAVMISSQSDESDYICVGTPPKNMKAFKAGEFDLLDLMNGRAGETWLTGNLVGSSHIEITESHSEPIPEKYLPLKGFYLKTPVGMPLILQRARVEGRLAASLRLEPADSVSEHAIKADTLASILSDFQRVVKHSFAKSNKDRKAEGLLFDSNLNILAFNQGSFQVDFTIDEPPNLFGASEAMPAFSIIGELLSYTGSETALLDTISHYKGHLANAYLSLLTNLAERRTSLQLTWADKLSEKAEQRLVTVSQARQIKVYLSQVQNLTTEDRTITGILKAVDVDTGYWRLLEGKTNYTGRLSESGPSLSGLAVDHKYRFHCQEEQEVTTSGKERTTYLLSSYENI